jgi:hypothetical protein
MSLAWCMIALSLVGADDQEARKPQPPSVVPRMSEVNTGQTQERWPMDLAMATRIAFDNSENFRLVQFGVNQRLQICAIHRRKAAVDHPGQVGRPDEESLD